MRMNEDERPSLLPWFISLFIFFCLPSYGSESAWILNKGSLLIELQPAYVTYMDNNSRFHELSLYNRLELGWVEPISLFFMLPFRTITHSDVAQAITNNGATDIHIGASFQMLKAPLALTLRGKIKVPTGYDITLLPSIGDRQLDLDLGLLAGYHLDEIPFVIQGGITYRYHSPFDTKHPLVVQGKVNGETIIRPGDQFITLLEMGMWVHPQLFISLAAEGQFALPQTQTWMRSSLVLAPLIAYRLNQFVDLSLRLDQTLWGINEFLSTGLQLGAHFHYGTNLPQAVGLRGGLQE